MTIQIDVLGYAVRVADEQAANALISRISSLETQARRVPELLTRLDAVDRDHDRIRTVLARLDGATTQAREILDEAGGGQ